MLITLRLRSYASDRCLIFKDSNARNISQMPLLLFDDDDQPPGPAASRFRVLVLLPDSLKRLIERIRRRLLGGA